MITYRSNSIKNHVRSNLDVCKEITLEFDTNVFSLETIKRAAYRLTDSGSPEFKVDGDTIKLILRFPKAVDQATASLIADEARIAVLDQDLRKRIADETSAERAVILGYAFSRTGLQSG